MLRGIEEEKVGVHRMDWTEMFQGFNLRRTLLCYATVAVATQSASDVWFLVAYQIYFLQ
ncbi:uncharacterized protein A1O5_00813 [Cladophialophora psammophila CBS 110553]|uniref:Uncharacterized protein n=1 Tax=Cladophialophora psammophila CBS 110553 TaxID=1182543 RepID=W9XG20_9EURO|nr:uncharacterized protein A1O5_00813 [Cladophialophora psammophila CBS 110553]EXJ76305.1 hypothetical protein A1O5_00813 [Cladophialophora psammophila CBS 110553]